VSRKVVAALHVFVWTAAAGLAGCGGSLSKPDGGSGTGGAAGSASNGGADGSAPGGTSGSDAAVPADLRARLDTAIATWTAAKSSCTTYSYNRRWASVFGAGASTEVEVRNDVPTRRRYSTLAAVDGGVDWMTVWDERGSEVGQHPDRQSQAAAASTMEQLLAECETVLALDPAEYYLTLEIDAAYGVPKVCTNFPRGCADDCERGMRIVTFACAPLD